MLHEVSFASFNGRDQVQGWIYVPACKPKGIVQVTKHNGIFGMNIYHVPIVPIFIMIFLVGLLQIVLSCVLSSNLKKETLVERIRYQG